MSLLSGAKAQGVGNCYVYKTVKDVHVLCAPSLEKAYQTGRWFVKGDLVSIDFIKKTPTDGPFLRLSDGSGWVYATKDGSPVMEPIPVETGLWCFYVHNHHAGIFLRNHPMDQLQKGCHNLLKQIPEVTLKPCLKIYCDRRVEGNDGVNFYRLQQQPQQYAAWVFDRRTEEGGREHRMLLPESKVQTGLFAFQALADIAIRYIPSLSNDTKTTWFVKDKDIVVCDLIQESVQPASGNGPYLRLVDGTGWLFVYKQNKKLMRQIVMEEGKWHFCVANGGGVQLRKQPIDKTPSRYPKIYKRDEVLYCDRMIASGSGTNYYRVENTDGWVLDKRQDFAMMWPIPIPQPSLDSASFLSGEENHLDSQQATIDWTVEFVRGVATRAMLEEIFHNKECKMIAYRHPDGSHINVSYRTKSVGMVLDQGTSSGRTQIFRHNCNEDELAEIFKNPSISAGPHGVTKSKPPTRPHTNSAPRFKETEVNKEDDFRNRLLELDTDVSAIEQRKKELWRTLEVHEGRREETETKMKQLTRAHAKAMLEGLVQNRQEDKSIVRAPRSQAKTSLAMIQIPRLPHALECDVRSKTGDALKKHFTADGHSPRLAHALDCYVCGKRCKNGDALKKHITANGHW